MDRFTALLDANVLYPAGLRDVLLRLADRNLYRPRWSATIHDEWIRNVLADRQDLTADRLQRTRALMDTHFADAVVTGYQRLIDGLTLPDAKDRHVLAAAIHGRADVIVTANLRDFPSETIVAYGIEAQHPDEFTGNLLNLYPGPVLAVAREHRAALKNPTRSPEEHLEAYRQFGLVQLAAGLGHFIDVI